MTVQTTSSKAGPFFGNGATLVWSSGFRIDQPADLWVIYTDPTGVETQLDATLYTATGFGDPDGISVTYPISGTPISAAEKITLLRVVNYDQQTSITNQGGFYPQVIERALDRIVYQTQQIAEKLGRAITLSASSALSGLFLPDPESGKYLRGRADGAGYENVELTSSGTIGLPLPVTQGGTGATTAAAARTALGLQSGATTTVGSAATCDAGTAANQVLLIPADGKMPTIDGSRLTGLPPTGMKNRIINGGMDIAQRGISFAAPSNGVLTLDRWKFITLVTTSVVTIGQTSIPAFPNSEFQNALGLTVTTADAAVGTTDQSSVLQTIEGYNVRDLIGRDFTVSFWVNSAKSGTHCVSFRNGNVDKSYVLEYTVNVANTWEFKTLTVAGGLITTGTWNWTSGIGLYVTWSVLAGSTYQTAAGSWQTGNFIATANQVNCMDTIGNIFALTGVQLEAGNVATPFGHRPFGEELSLCQRYYTQSFDLGHYSGEIDLLGGAEQYISRGADSNDRVTVTFPVWMRIAPSVVLYNYHTAATGSLFDATHGTSITSSVQGQSMRCYVLQPTANTTTAARYAWHWTADAEL